MGKLKLKTTPAEQVARDLKRARKAVRKEVRAGGKRKRRDGGAGGRGYDYGDPLEEPREEMLAAKRSHVGSSKDPYDLVFDFDEDEGDCFDPLPRSPNARKPHLPTHLPKEKAAYEEQSHFREKLWSALREDDDERLDSVEAQFNSYAHVPMRWRRGGMVRTEEDWSVDPQGMEEEDYAEWVRVGMWRKKHASEHAEQVRVQQETAARLAREEAVRVETKRLQKEAEEERRRKKRETEMRRQEETRERYEIRWRELLLAPSEDPGGVLNELEFGDIPWPVFLPKQEKGNNEEGTLDFFTAEAISAFLFPSGIPFQPPSNANTDRKDHRDRLRDALLRFHPDKFESRILPRVIPKDRVRVKSAGAKVVIALNSLKSSVN